MERKKTSIYISEPILRAAKALAAAQGRKEYEVFEDALRQYIGHEASRHNWERPDAPSEEEAMGIALQAIDEVRKHRKGDDAIAS